MTYRISKRKNKYQTMVLLIVDIDTETEIVKYDFVERVSENNALPDDERQDDIILLAEFQALLKREDDVIVDGKTNYVVSLPPETDLEESTITIYVEKMGKKKKKSSKRGLGR